MGKSYKKPSSTEVKRLPTSHLMPGAGRVLLVSPSVESGATATQHDTSSLPTHSNDVLHPVTCKEILKVLSGVQQEYLVYEGMSFSDYIYIKDHLESDRYQKTWNRRVTKISIARNQVTNFRLSFFPGSKHLMVSSPTTAHESIISALMDSHCNMLATIPVPEDVLYFRTHTNSYLQEDSICAVPDSTIMMWDNDSCEDIRIPQPIWLMESAFSQSDHDIMWKLHTYVRNVSDLLVIGKIHIKQAMPYHSPASGGSAAKYLRSSELMTQAKWTSSYGKKGMFTQVVVDGHTWFSLSSVEIHIWVHQPGKSKIDLNCLDDRGYACGMIYPTVSLDDVDNAFCCSFELIKELTLCRLRAANVDQALLLDQVENWSPPTGFMDQDVFKRALVDSAWAMSYQRYHDWHVKQRRSSNTTPHRSQRSRTCASCSVGNITPSNQPRRQGD
ncbi:hypothetical protein SCLCIDRAFT_28197 [Scleroderma citrinum Foug A]|uniref:Uncharacterized protein n=1 Tax=Scleroderma citrinum Foug A TaxID=1036808 RepID=A0A0C3A0U2_9AGAM|nr:hypothetical protein SCLCIDRAFT_28197 [Scleroderma citrinum Foug A]